MPNKNIRKNKANRFTNSACRAEVTINEQLREEFNDFMKHASASLAERQFLNQVFEAWRSRYYGEDLGIASAFEDAIANMDVHVLTCAGWVAIQFELHELRAFRQKFAINEPGAPRETC